MRGLQEVTSQSGWHRALSIVAAINHLTPRAVAESQRNHLQIIDNCQLLIQSPYFGFNAFIPLDERPKCEIKLQACNIWRMSIVVAHSSISHSKQSLDSKSRVSKWIRAGRERATSQDTQRRIQCWLGTSKPKPGAPPILLCSRLETVTFIDWFFSLC